MTNNAASPVRSNHRSSPRPSEDSHTPNSPFFQSLQQRFRRASHASRTTSIESSSGVDDPTTKSEASKSAKRVLFSVIRDDWVYPLTHDVDPKEVLPSREPRGFSARQQSLSDLDGEEGFASRAKKRSKTDPYRFEDPDAVAALVRERKRKRKHLVEEEMQWNTGLKNWALQRDAWTGAVEHKPEDNSSAILSESPASTTNGFHGEKKEIGSAAKKQLQPELNSSVEGEELQTKSKVDEDDDVQDGPWLPIYAPLLGDDHPISSRIQPSAYPTIYSKVVVQSLAPNIPIPLLHMTAALVEGWKSEGNWPPQMTGVAAADMKTGKRSSAFSMWRKEQENRNKTSKGRIRRSFGGAVKKVLGVAEEDPVEELGIEFREQDEEEREELVTIGQPQTNGNG